MTAVTNFNYCLKYIIVGDSCNAIIILKTNVDQL